MTEEEKKARKREIRKRWLERNPEWARQYRLKNIDKIRARSRRVAKKWRERHPDHAKNYYRDNREEIARKTREAKQANPEKFRERDRRYYKSPKGRASFLVQSAKQRSKNVTIDRHWVQERLNRGYCEVTGLPFIVDCNAIKNPWAPSLDQIRPGQGYTPENTQVVVWIYNVAKGSWAHGDVLKLANALLRLKDQAVA